MVSKWPRAKNVLNLDNYYLEFFSIISTIRNYKNVNNIPPKTPIKVYLVINDINYYNYIKNEEVYLSLFLNASVCEIINEEREISDSIVLLTTKSKIYLSKENLVDDEKEKTKLIDKITIIKKEVERGTNMLSNPNFLSKAKKEKVIEEENKLQDNKSQLASLLLLLKKYE